MYSTNQLQLKHAQCVHTRTLMYHMKNFAIYMQRCHVSACAIKICNSQLLNMRVLCNVAMQNMTYII